MRWGIALVIAVLQGAFAFGCVDNEESFFIEHVKAQPQAPDCEVSVSDGNIAMGLLDLSFRNSYTGWYLVNNGLVSREDLGNLVTETNGIIVDGAEVYVRALNGAVIGATEYYEFERFIPPEEESIAFALSLPGTIVGELAASQNCPVLTSLSGQLAVNATVYSVVRFIGHTNGDVDVETPEFTFPIELCCGCLVEWANCADPCSRFCEEPEKHGMCTPGVYNGGDLYDCRYLYYDDPDKSWDCDGGTCTCADC